MLTKDDIESFLVRLGATGATVALTWWQARDQVSEAASASRETTELITEELRRMDADLVYEQTLKTLVDGGGR